jgi:hypothetical protein
LALLAISPKDQQVDPFRSGALKSGFRRGWNQQQYDQMSLRKNLPKCSPTHLCQICMYYNITFTLGKRRSRIWAISKIFNFQKRNNRQMGENSPKSGHPDQQGRLYRKLAPSVWPGPQGCADPSDDVIASTSSGTTITADLFNLMQDGVGSLETSKNRYFTDCIEVLGTCQCQPGRPDEFGKIWPKMLPNGSLSTLTHAVETNSPKMCAMHFCSSIKK